MAYEEKDDNGKEYYRYKLVEERVSGLHKLIEEKEKRYELQIANLSQEVELRDKLNQLAIDKSETTITERQEVSNGKYELMRQQAETFQQTFATHSDIVSVNEKVGSLTKLVYIGLGIVLAFQFIILILIKFFKPPI